MNTRLFAAPIALAVARLFIQEFGENQPGRDAGILALVLKHSYRDGGYTVVDPDTKFRYGDPDDPERFKQVKEHLRRELETAGVDVGKVVEELFARNSKTVRLSLKSAQADGYIVDYDGTFAKYFEKNGGGWEKWRQDQPNARGMTSVSLPAYDPGAGSCWCIEGLALIGSWAGVRSFFTSSRTANSKCSSA